MPTQADMEQWEVRRWAEIGVGGGCELPLDAIDCENRECEPSIKGRIGLEKGLFKREVKHSSIDDRTPLELRRLTVTDEKTKGNDLTED
ncbi:hypothetical protein K435DRAFT_774647 [Dendrothele bispora CBS 962.96]|uniref:Uncharacterized protein n=1 Tax=Dendrothele bispora (strain CBS 962.96) TaxID=1314807 RepID=A0A4S8MM90_DENBC|nr:hypothetical protein K435DRAFT_774647 [Dendrothele bispora CBS 962.96]